MKPINIHIFRRDFRIRDNLSLNLLARTDPNPIIPLFIFDDCQIDPKKNRYYSSNCVEFMLQSLHDLDDELDGKLICLHGDFVQCVRQILNSYQIKHIAFNLDYTPFARERDRKIIKWCNENDIGVITGEDYTLLPIGYVLTGGKPPEKRKLEGKIQPDIIEEAMKFAGHAYKVMTPYYNRFLDLKQNVKQPDTSKKINFLQAKVSNHVSHWDQFLENKNPNLMMKGGRKEGEKKLRQIRSGAFNKYVEERDYPAQDATTHLSPYLKFGCISVREAYWAMVDTYGQESALVKEVIWRNFYAEVAYYFPQVLQGQISGKNQPFQEKYAKMDWDNDKSHIKAFTSGKTGVPMVDAAVRQLLTTGWCHNRCRMIIANYGVKDLFIDWTILERWYASHAVDYDPASNNGGWSWGAGVGVDSQKYFRTFNAYTQAVKFDNECEYIKKWVLELKDVDNKAILKWDDKCEEYKDCGYNKPIVDHKKKSKEIIEKYKEYN